MQLVHEGKDETSNDDGDRSTGRNSVQLQLRLLDGATSASEVDTDVMDPLRPPHGTSENKVERQPPWRRQIFF